MPVVKSMTMNMNTAKKNWKADNTLTFSSHKPAEVVLLATLLQLTGTLLHPVYAESAEQIYFRVCYICHGDDAAGNMPGVADLADNKSLFSDNEQLVIQRIKSGINRPGKLSMPPKGGDPDLTDEQLSSVLHYVKSLVKQ